MAKQVLKPWKDVCILRDEIRTKALTMADFAVDLHRVMFEPGSEKYYTDPVAFLGTTYATPNLRKFCHTDGVVLPDHARQEAADESDGGAAHSRGSEAGESTGRGGGGGIVRQ